jgi:hypothetical protein
MAFSKFQYCSLMAPEEMGQPAGSNQKNESAKQDERQSRLARPAQQRSLQNFGEFSVKSKAARKSVRETVFMLASPSSNP